TSRKQMYMVLFPLARLGDMLSVPQRVRLAPAQCRSLGEILLQTRRVCYTVSSLGRNRTLVLPCLSSDSSLTVNAIPQKSLLHAGGMAFAKWLECLTHGTDRSGCSRSARRKEGDPCC